jgi:stearoyl-CoA desaturase (Delta-9 desaturase)
MKTFAVGPAKMGVTVSGEARLASLARLDRRLAWVVTLAPVAGFVLAMALIAWGVPIGPLEIGLWLGMHALILIGVEVGFHRHFSHRAFKAHPAVRNTLAVLGSMAFQGPVIWWAATHRRHHAFSDHAGDPHSPHRRPPGLLPFLKGQLHAHMGWLFVPSSTRGAGWDRYGYDLYRDRAIFTIHGLYFYWLAAGFVLPGLIAGVVTQTIQGALTGVLWGGFVRVFMMNHMTYWCINSVTHTFGKRPFLAGDRSVNNGWLALPTLGQSWHNNHHAFPASAIMSVHWWQIDVGGWIIRALEILGLAWDVHEPTAELIERRTPAAVTAAALDSPSA